MNNEVSVKPLRSLDDALERCQALGMRLSRQRRAILELLWAVPDHLCARDIYDRLSQAGKDIGYTSVYQNLEALSSHGIIECIERSDGRLYGNISDPHSHINCLDTQEIIDVYVELPAELIAQIEAKTGIRITDYRIDFFGYHAARSAQPVSTTDDRQTLSTASSHSSASSVASASSIELSRNELSSNNVPSDSLNARSNPVSNPVASSASSPASTSDQARDQTPPRVSLEPVPA